MEFKLTPVEKIPEYVDIYCGYRANNHDHLPILWRNSKKDSIFGYLGWASWDHKACFIDFNKLYFVHRDSDDFLVFIQNIISIFYHEFLHLFFKFRFGKWHYAEKRIKILAYYLTIEELDYLNNNFWVEYFEDCRCLFNG